MGVEEKKVLILGGGGFIGVNIARTLLRKGNYEVTLVDNFSRGNDRVAPIGSLCIFGKV